MTIGYQEICDFEDGSYCCVDYRGQEWPAILCTADMVPEDIVKPSQLHRPALLMSILKLIWVEPSQISEFVPSARIHVGLRSNAKEVFYAYEAVAESEFADLAYWKGLLLAKTLIEVGMEEGQVKPGEDIAKIRKGQAKGHETQVQMKEKQTELKTRNSTKQSTLDSFLCSYEHLSRATKIGTAHDRMVGSKPLNSPEAPPFKGKRCRFAKRTRKKREAARNKAKNPRRSRIQGKRSPIYQDEEDDDDNEEEEFVGLRSLLDTHYEYDEMDIISSATGWGANGVENGNLANLQNLTQDVMEENTANEFLELTTSIEEELEANASNESIASSDDQAPAPTIDTAEKQVTLIVGEKNTEFQVPLRNVLTQAHLSAFLVQSSARGATIRLENISEVLTQHFRAVVEFLRCGDFYSPADPTTSRLLGITDDNERKYELLRFALLFNFARKFQMHDFSNLIVTKIICLHPLPRDQAAKVTAFVLSMPPSGTESETRLKDVLADWMASDIKGIMKDFSVILGHPLDRNPAFLNVAIQKEKTKCLFSDDRFSAANDEFESTDHLHGYGSVDEFLEENGLRIEQRQEQEGVLASS